MLDAALLEVTQNPLLLRRPGVGMLLSRLMSQVRANGGTAELARHRVLLPAAACNAWLPAV
jgi:hypothetical protein